MLMKSQARLRLRQAGRHHLTEDDNGFWPRWTYQQRIANNLSHAFEMNAQPKHMRDEPPTYYTMNYVTGEKTWHGPPYVRYHNDCHL